MSRIVPLFSLLVFFLIFPSSVIAQDRTSSEYYQELLQNYRQYESLVGPFNTQRTRHLTYQTVATQVELLNVSKKLISAEIESMISYTSFIKKLLAEATQILNYRENYLYVKLDDELAFLSLAKSRVDSLSSLPEAESLMKDLETHYKDISQMGYQIKSIIEIGSAEKILKNVQTEKEKIRGLLSEESTASSKAVAATEKLESMNTSLEEVSRSLQEAEALQQQYGGGSAQSLSSRIKGIAEKVYPKLSEAISVYKNIIYSLR